MKLNKKLIITILLSLVFTISNLWADTIAQIGNTKISVAEFQVYVDIQKLVANKKNFNELVQEGKISKNVILTKYLDQKILLLNAKKKGYSKDNPLVKSRYNASYLKWIGQIYTLKNVKVPNNEDITESDLKTSYNKYQSGGKKYESLTQEEKSSLYQIVLIQRLKVARDKFQKKLEKKYKVSRGKINSNVVATVEGSKISQNDLKDLLQKQFANFGLDIETAKKRNKKQFDNAVEDARDELIFNKLINLDMKKTKFLNKKIVKATLNSYNDQVIVEVFIIQELLSKAKVTERELDLAFQQLSKIRPQIKQLVPTEQEKVLRQYILQKRQEQIIGEFLTEQKEGILIKRNKKLLQKIV